MKAKKMIRLRNQRILKSKRHDDLYNIEGVNQVYLCFDLVGIYKEYCDRKQNNLTDDFRTFYNKCRNENRLHHYKNKGTAIIYDVIKSKRSLNQLNTVKYEITRKSMSRYGIKRNYRLVKVYESSAVVLEILLEYIMKNEEMSSIYNDIIKRETMEDYFAFQDALLLKNLNMGGLLTSKRICFNRIRTQLANIIGDENNAVL